LKKRNQIRKRGYSPSYPYVLYLDSLGFYVIFPIALGANDMDIVALLLQKFQLREQQEFYSHVGAGNMAYFYFLIAI